MKKLLIAAIALMGFSAASYAQSMPVKKQESKTQVTQKKQPGKHATTKMVAIHKTKRPAGKTVTKTVAKSTTQQKAPGNASSTTTVTKTESAHKPMKKNGTPDMRYKENKNVATASSAHLKKNGTPDKRFKENKKHS